MSTESMKASVWKGRLTLLLLLLFFMAPVLIVLFLHTKDWHPQGKSYGELVSPVRPLRIPESIEKPILAKSHAATLWNEKWNIVYISSDCEATCKSRLHDMRQIHMSLAGDIERLQRVLISNSDQIKDAAMPYPDMVLINAPQNDVFELAKQFNLDGEDALKQDRIYLVDPLGNLMMSYKANTPAVEIRKDILKLLKFSWAG